ncbi:MAG: DNA-binding protein [Gammaproteobacteria bacterium]|nr:DNA-binding protein [Gammaproteobacteria bacterium]
MKSRSTILILSVILLLVIGGKGYAQAQNNRIYGKVTEIINISGYTYLQVDDGKTQTWAAGPVTSVNKGDMVAFDLGMVMRDFHSKALNRDFEVIYFVNRFISDKVTTGSAQDLESKAHGKVTQGHTGKTFKGIKKLKNGNTIAEIYAHKESLKDKTIRVRGQVSKFTGEILGKNWLHIRDSSTLDDLTVTTDDTVAVDDIVIIEGKLKLDKDYSYGYVYPVIVEDATVIKE